MTEDQLRFHLEEYGQLRSEMASILGYGYNLLTYSIALSGAIFAWFLKDGRDVLIAKWAPFCIAALSFAASYSLMERMKTIGNYLARLEKMMGSSDLGWEQHLEGTRVGLPLLGRSSYPLLIVATAWVVLLTVDLVVPTFVH